MNKSHEIKRENISRQEKILRDFFNSYNGKIRRPREFDKKLKERDNITESKSTIDPKVVLVKKPIPKFTDTESSEEDYQIKMKYPVKYSDSMEHEDDDFNLDDYDFDIHHDDFAGRGKPLEPRTKIKLIERRSQLEEGDARPKSQLNQNKLIMPRKVSQVSNKVARKAVHLIKIDDYDDVSTSTEAPRKKSRTSDDDMSSENEDTKEYESQGSVRTVRSLLSYSNYIDKLNEKSTALVSKILGYLPIFPQVPPKN
ncbi:uncharacterized protein LOC126776461 [Nymphalis io]|uniref:uncharacterized protein LOC126776461 n=1 Tax=Inachis io TaxID=171585 RepID=UPI002169C601|nr:uncharacterized protein LOC126776461 [Nymphalis io]